MIIQFLNHNTRKVEYTLDLPAVPRKGEMLAIDDGNFRILNVSHVIDTKQNLTWILCLYCTPEVYLKNTYGRLQ